MKIHCNRCQNETNQTILAQQEGKYEWGGPSVYFKQRYSIVRCKGCEEISFLIEEDDKLTDNESETLPFEASQEKSATFPPRLFRRLPSWFNSIPRGEQKLLLQEVYAALQKLALMGVRTMLDRVITDVVGDYVKEGDKQTDAFKTKLKAYAAQTLGVRTRDAIIAVFNAGSAAAHRAYNPSETQIFDVIDHLEHILYEQYILRQGTDRIEDETPAKPPRPKGQLLGGRMILRNEDTLATPYFGARERLPGSLYNWPHTLDLLARRLMSLAVTVVQHQFDLRLRTNRLDPGFE